MRDTSVGKKIIVLGCPGSGKSTLSRKLGEKLGLPLVHLDNIWWRPDRSHISREEFDRRLAGILSGDEWIIDGDYSRTYEVRFKKCDTVIFLDLPVEICLKGISDRRGSARDDIPWVEDAVDPELKAQIRRYGSENRPEIYRLMEKYPKVRTVVLTSREEADSWLDGIGTL